MERRHRPNSLLKLPYPSTARAGSSSAQKYDAGNIRVKLIDFGSSCFANVPRIYPYVQSRFYRAPEVMLRDREYDQSIDMWSFACVLAELKRGSPIWPGTDEAETVGTCEGNFGRTVERISVQTQTRGGFEKDVIFSDWRCRRSNAFNEG